MALFDKKKAQRIEEGDKKVRMPAGLWVSCPGCREIVYRAELERSLRVCPKCQYHFRLTSGEWLGLLLDPDSFTRMDEEIRPADPLKFRDRKKYADRLKALAKEVPHLTDALVAGPGRVEGYPIELGIFDFEFMAGSMGSVVGERIARAADRALARRCPLLLITVSGGARMQEGIVSLMQMAKTTAAVSQLIAEGIPYWTLLTDPTTGGVTASFAMQADVIIAEPGAMIGFAGPRVIQQTINCELPEGFQKAEFLLAHGMVDLVVPRPELRGTIAKLMRIHYGPKPEAQQP
jgi:acetyl-CoA carboxylase carboxyl transferase subunit beta